MKNTGQIKLKIDNISLSFGGVQVLFDVSLDVREKEIVAIIGPNGAGKTSLLNCINGFYKPNMGEIYFEGQRITRMRPDKVAKLGIARSFQNIELYSGLTTLENIMAARHPFIRENLFTSSLYYGWALKNEIEHREIAEEIIDFLEIQQIRKQLVGRLPYGMRKRVELARALALEPKILVLDEPMAGMNLEEKEDIARFILDIYQGQGNIYSKTDTLRKGVSTIVLIEHDMQVVMDLSHRVVVLDFGHKIAEGTPAEIESNPVVIKAYLGEGG